MGASIVMAKDASMVERHMLRLRTEHINSGKKRIAKIGTRVYAVDTNNQYCELAIAYNNMYNLRSVIELLLPQLLSKLQCCY